jgi:hypothetical protein
VYFEFADIASDNIDIVERQGPVEFDDCDELDGIELVRTTIQATMMNDFRELSSE